MLISFKKSKQRPVFNNFFGNFSTPAKVLLPALLTVGLAGCGEPTIAEICRDHGEFCQDLNPDSWCRFEKAGIIRHRYDYREDNSDAPKYQLLLEFEDYQKCIEKAAQIQHIKHREKEAGRLKGVVTAQRELKRLARETRNSPDPYLSYYQFSRFGHKDAYDRFVAYAASGQLKDPALMVALASMQYKEDLTQTTATLYQALSMYEDDKEIDQHIFQSLITIGLEQEKYRMAYVWSLVAGHYDKGFNTLQRDAIAQKFNLPIAVLEDVADEIIDALEDGEFNANALGLNRL